MTTIVFRKGTDQAYKGVYCMGHAGYTEKKPFSRTKKPEIDIVCLAVSVLMQSTISALDEIAGVKMDFAQNEETGFVRCDFLEPLQEKSVFLMDYLVYSMKELEKKYGEKYLQVKFEEV